MGVATPRSGTARHRTSHLPGALPGRIALLVTAGLVAGSLLVQGGEAFADKTALIVSTASIRGETKSCGCKKKDLGGLDRRATLIKEEQDENPSALVVDAGDFGAHQEAEPWVRTEFQWQMMGKLGYDAVTLGPNELLAGIDAVRALTAENPDIQVVSANVTDKSGTLVYPESAIIERGGVTYGVTGVVSPSLYDFNTTRGINQTDDFAFQDEREALMRVVPKLRNEAEVVVVLLHSSPGDAKRIVADMPGMDVVVVGHNPGYTFTPERVGQTLMVRPGARGQYTSVLKLSLTDDGKIVDYDGQSFPIGKGIAQDPDVTSLVDAFEARYDDLTADEEAKPEGSR